MPGICFRCKEYVHQAEEKLALGSSWHLECFTCAICNTTLDSTSMSESSKGKEIYCRKCYKKNYCIPGYGFGPTKPTLLSVTAACDWDGSSSGASCPCCPCGRSSTATEVEPFVQPPSRQGQEYTPRLPPPRHYAKQVVIPAPCSCCKCEKDVGVPSPRVQTYNLSHLPNNEASWKHRQEKRSSSAPRAKESRNRGTTRRPSTSHSEDRRETYNPCVEQQSPQGQCSCCCPPPEPRPSSGCGCDQGESKSRRRSPTRPKTPSFQGVAICQKCGRDVFFAERVMGYRGAYHLRCFVCYNCRKTLDSTTVNEHQGELYCKGCYKHKYGTIGVGYGIGAGTLQTP